MGCQEQEEREAWIPCRCQVWGTGLMVMTAAGIKSNGGTQSGVVTRMGLETGSTNTYFTND